jgi:hypothetical protein
MDEEQASRRRDLPMKEKKSHVNSETTTTNGETHGWLLP